jgi:Secretion system C-terminal sorting domain
MRFVDNYASHGGAVHIDGLSANVQFTDCQFIDNYADNGVCLYTFEGAATFTHCLFTGSDLGSGLGTVIYGYYGSGLTLDCCTIADNSEPDASLLFLFNTPTTISSSIIADNDCWSPIHSSLTGLTDLGFSTIHGNSGGNFIDGLEIYADVNGNVEQDPAFVDGVSGDYHLLPDSPCIDTGDPTLPSDPDNTVADMGAFYYPQADAELSVTFHTEQNPLHLPPRGGVVRFAVTVQNNLDIPATFDCWTAIATPDGNTVAPLMSAHLWLAEGGQIDSRVLSQMIPDWVPAGEYSFTVNAGSFPNIIIDSDEILIIKHSPNLDQSGMFEDWSTLASPWESAGEEELAVPESFSISPAYPNPFNGTTSVSMTLDEARYVEVELVDLLGRHVQTLMNSVQRPGLHLIEVDGRGLSTGMYFLHASADGYGDQLQKIVLLK